MNSYLVKSAIFNAVSDLQALKSNHEIDVRKLGMAVEHITKQRWYGFITKMVKGEINTSSWTRKEYGRKLGKGFLTKYVKLHGLTL